MRGTLTDTSIRLRYVVVAQKIEEGTKHIASIAFDTRQEAQDVVDAYNGTCQSIQLAWARNSHCEFTKAPVYSILEFEVVKLSCKVRELCRELDKIDPVWYNSSMKSEYRNFDGNINNTGGAEQWPS